MAFQVLSGKFRSKVLDFSFEMAGKEGDEGKPVIKVNFQPMGEYVGEEVQAKEGLPRQNFTYWLDVGIQTGGKHAGKSGLEALKLTFQEQYGYSGSLTPEGLSALQDKEVDLICIPNGNFTKVKYVNAIGGKKTKRAVRAMTPEQIAAFDKLFSGQAATPVQDAKSLFEQLSASK